MKKRLISIISVFLVVFLLLGCVSCGASGKAENDYASKDSYAGEAAGLLMELLIQQTRAWLHHSMEAR